MARIIVDLTGDEQHWNGEIGVDIRPDTLSGDDVALAIGDHEIIGSVTQMITLWEKLDVWISTIEKQPRGAVEQRLRRAIDTAVAEATPVLGEVWAAGFDRQGFSDTIRAAIDAAGLRFAIAAEEG